jgi:hypothetical protein
MDTKWHMDGFSISGKGLGRNCNTWKYSVKNVSINVKLDLAGHCKPKKSHGVFYQHWMSVTGKWISRYGTGNGFTNDMDVMEINLIPKI